MLIQKYEEVFASFPSDSELIELSSVIARKLELERLTSIKGINLLTSRESNELRQEIKKFLEVFCATAMMVIAQYFVNPYSDDEIGCLKRPLSPWSQEDSEEEENFEPVRSKKRKFSF